MNEKISVDFTLKQLKDLCRLKSIPVSNKDTKRTLQQKLKRKTMAEELKKGNISKEQIAEWKKKHGTVHRISVVVKKDENGKVTDEAVGYLRKPTRNHKATAMSMYAQNKILECGEFLRNNCWLGGDERLKDNGDIADTAAIQANGIIQFLDGDLGEV